MRAKPFQSPLDTPEPALLTDRGVNALAESFWASLKRECIRGRVFTTRAEARRAIFKWITWYNSKRLHSSLDHTAPITWEQQYRHAS